MVRFEGTPADFSGTPQLVSKDLVPWLREYDGFRGVLVMIGEEQHAVLTLWASQNDETSTRQARLAMHETVSAATGMTLVDYEVFDLPVVDLVG